MEKFETPKIEVTKITMEDVITTSPGGIENPTPGGNGTVIG